MKNRIFALLLCAVFVLSFFGCTKGKVNTDNDPTAQTEATVPLEIEGYTRIDRELLDFDSPIFKKMKLTKGYESLDNDEQRAAYKLIDSYIIYISDEKIDGDYKVHPVDMRGITLSEAELHFIISAYSMDHPEVFWLKSQFGYYTTDNQTFLQINSGMSAAEIISCAKEIRIAVTEIFGGVTAYMTEYERELELHNAFTERCEYANTEDERADEFRIYTCVGALIDGYAVCEGYSRAMQILLSAAGIETYYVLGIGNSELHMWNTVRIESQWYYLDSTWNDSDNMGADYDYFNVTTDQILKDHTISPLYWDLTPEEVCGSENGKAANFNLFVPECVNKDSNFYAQRSVKLQGFDDMNLQKVADAMVEAVAESRTAIYLYLDPDYLDFYEGLNNLFYSGDYAIFSCIKLANEQLTDIRIQEQFVNAAESPEFSVVTVYIEY